MFELSQAAARILLQNLEHMVESYQSSLGEANEAVREAERQRGAWEERLKSAKSLLEFERERLGGQLSLDSGSPYAGLTLREAALRVIKGRQGRATTLDEVVQVLREAGYRIETRFPGRALHAALIGVQDVEKVAPGTYRWRANGPSRSDEVTVGDN